LERYLAASLEGSGPGLADGGDFDPDGGPGGDDAGVEDDAGMPDPPSVQPAPDLDSDVFRQSALLAELPDGRVWVGGGLIARAPEGGGPSLQTGREEAEVIDPSDDTFVDVDPMAQGRYAGRATVLPDGRILVTGGLGGPAGEFAERRDTAEVVDPETFETTLLPATMSAARAGHLTWIIAAGPRVGQVLLLGGDGPPMTAEVFDPATDTFSPLTVFDAPTESAGRAVRLTDGRVLYAGGEGDPDVFDRSYVFDPTTATFSESGGLGASKRGHSLAALPDGGALVTGGNVGVTPLATAERWDPATGEWSATDDLLVARSAHASAPLGSGRIVIAGGALDGAFTDSVEVYDPASGTFSVATGALTGERAFPQALSLSDGRVMVIGGQLRLGGGNVLVVSTVDYVAE